MKDILWFLAAALIGAALLSQFAEAEDCYRPSPYVNKEIYHTVELHRFRPKLKLRAQAKRRAKNRSIDNFIYFVDKKATKITATHGSLGLDKSYGTGRHQDLDLALLIAQGHEKGDFDGSWDEGFLVDIHKDWVYEEMCEQRNHCRALYLPNKKLLALCFQDLKNWPEDRTYLPNFSIKTFGELVTIYAQ